MRPAGFRSSIADELNCYTGQASLCVGTVTGACPRSVTASRKSLENKDFYRPRHCASPRTVTVPTHSDSQIIHQTKRHPHRENDAIPARPNRMIRSPEPVAEQSETAPKSPSRNDAPPCAEAARPPQGGPAVEGDIDRDRIHRAGITPWRTGRRGRSSNRAGWCISFGICSVSSTIGTLALLAAPVI